MTRALPPGVASQLALENAQRVHLLELRFSSGTLYLTDAPEDVVINGQTYTAVGGLIEIGTAEESADGRSQGLTLALSGVDQGIVSALLNTFYRGRLAILSRVYFDDNGTVVGGPVELFRGYMNESWRVRSQRSEGFDEGTVRVETRVVSRLAVAEQRRGMRTNLVSHQRVYQDDMFFQYVNELSDRTIRWGPNPVRIVGGGSEEDQRKYSNE